MCMCVVGHTQFLVGMEGEGEVELRNINTQISQVLPRVCSLASTGWPISSLI